MVELESEKLTDCLIRVSCLPIIWRTLVAVVVWREEPWNYSFTGMEIWWSAS